MLLYKYFIPIGSNRLLGLSLSKSYLKILFSTSTAIRLVCMHLPIELFNFGRPYCIAPEHHSYYDYNYHNGISD